MRYFPGLLLLAVFGCQVKMPRISTESIESIVVTIYENEDLMGVREDFTLIIPKDESRNILALTLPDKLAETGLYPLRIGTVKIKYKDNTFVTLEAFWFGKNPCMVSLDGKHLYFAKYDSDAPDGASGLIRDCFKTWYWPEGLIRF